MANKTFRKLLLRSVVGIVTLAMLFTATACKNKNKNAESATLPSEEPQPTVLKVEDIAAKAGDKNVAVTVSVTGNPGILGMDFDVYYDDSVAVLTDARSELDVPGHSYTAPAYFRNPTTFLWDFEDGNWNADETILTLFFDIAENAEPGAYEVKLMYSYGNIFDNNGDPINVDVTNAVITVLE